MVNPWALITDEFVIAYAITMVVSMVACVVLAWKKDVYDKRKKLEKW